MLGKLNLKKLQIPTPHEEKIQIFPTFSDFWPKVYNRD